MFSYKNIVILRNFNRWNKQPQNTIFMGKNKKNKSAAYSKREEEKAKKVVRNLIIGLIVIAFLFVAVSSWV